MSLVEKIVCIKTVSICMSEHLVSQHLHLDCDLKITCFILCLIFRSIIAATLAHLYGHKILTFITTHVLHTAAQQQAAQRFGMSVACALAIGKQTSSIYVVSTPSHNPTLVSFHAGILLSRLMNAFACVAFVRAVDSTPIPSLVGQLVVMGAICWLVLP